MSKIAVVLFNLGGPDSLKAVKPFLFSLFNDPAILTMRQPMRGLLAYIIASLRSKKAQAIYRQLGGKSPLLEVTLKQAEALQARLKLLGSKGEYRVFVCMRHSHPKSDMVVKKVKSFGPDEIILLPLYPQFSTTTTESALLDWREASRRNGLAARTTSICCYPGNRGLVAAHAKLIRDSYWKASEHGKPRVLFTAHGLPEKIIAAGDPYQGQVEHTVEAISQVLAIDNLDYVVCYQSRVGRLEWIGPSTEDEIIQAGKDGVPVVLVPVSFVSEHSETLVELDIEYRELSEKKGVPGFWRVPALGTEPFFIEALAELCLASPLDGKIAPGCGDAICPNRFSRCLCREEEAA